MFRKCMCMVGSGKFQMHYSLDKEKMRKNVIKKFSILKNPIR